MNKIGFAITLLLLIIAAPGQQRVVSQTEPQSSTSFVEVKGQPEVEPEFEFSVSGYKYKLLSNGRGERTGAGHVARKFNLRLRKGDSLDHHFYHAEYKGDLLLICEVSDGNYGAGFITRLDGQTLRIKWKQQIPGFNVGPGLLEGDHAYLTAIGFIGKVNLRAGAVAWKHENLYQNDRFNFFELPKVEGDAVLFKEVVIRSEPARTIKVQKQTGKIISVS